MQSGFLGAQTQRERERERECVCVCVLAAGRTVASYMLLITVLHSDDGFFAVFSFDSVLGSTFDFVLAL